MNLKGILDSLDIKSVTINAKFLSVELDIQDHDREAAWDLYVELATRISTQDLDDLDGDEQSALKSIHDIFKITRDILKEKGRKAKVFSRISLIVLNIVIRPFTAKWHKQSLQGAFNYPDRCAVFRKELRELQYKLRKYNEILAQIAEVDEYLDFEYCVTI